MSGAARFPDGLERRAAAELRAAGRRLEGYAAVFAAEARIGGFTETIRAGAFRASLAAGGDVLALVDHDPGRLLARTASGTLRLAEDTRGLHFSLDVPDTTLGRDILALAERRDLGGMSFSFRVKDEAWPAADRRELRAVELLEVSVVHAWPAYAATTVQARSRTAQGAAAAARARFLETL
ncbi:HK97 family phage prohead protease [Roseomonas sp. OT10]|uniref:HK97 family phage prohead protease n=1 Tax=Roseomonas cutis TaxID=2897332 RepID=UPI001E46CC2F|nr:HK97 family phage prohead protease [Roseomonas sp. OT10]UFN48129.1 HK97 family phage prohead protease [Roseomonas sp. OT10]